MNAYCNPIGFFDSGVGGISIWEKVTTLLPNENTLYLADSKNAPYGQKSKDEIIQFSTKNTEFLLNHNVKIIVVACNTATTNAIQFLRSKYDVPFIGIEPAIKTAGLMTKTQRIGILATQGTLTSELFEQTSRKINPTVEIIEQVGDGLVDLIENGALHSPKTIQLLQKYLSPMIHQNIDSLVLGCTHYPFLIPEIKKIIGDTIKIIDSGSAVARQTKNILIKNKVLQIHKNSKVEHQFYSNKNTIVLSKLIPKSKAIITLNDF